MAMLNNQMVHAMAELLIPPSGLFFFKGNIKKHQATPSHLAGQILLEKKTLPSGNLT